MLDILVQKRRNTGAATAVLSQVVEGAYSYVPNRLVTDKLRSYGAASSRSVCRRSITVQCSRPTIVPKCPTNQPANANATCVASNLYDTYSGFYPSTVPSTISFGLDGT